MKINRAEHPNVTVTADIDGKAHLVDNFGDPWCEGEDIELDGQTSPPEDEAEWCPGCVASGRDEGVFL